jgi:hypothetical protein
MLLISSFDFFGDEALLKKWDAAWKKACEETKGITYKGRYASHQARYHYCYIYESDSYDKLMEAFGKISMKRDYNVITHNVLEAFNGPLDV